MIKRLGLFGGLLLFLISFECKANAEKEALEAIAKATSKQFGIEQMLAEWVKKQVPEPYIKYASMAAPVVEAISTGTVRLTWELK